MFASAPALGHPVFRKILRLPKRAWHPGSRRASRLPPRAQNDKPDLIERVFGGLFGKAALDSREPLGMKRMSEQALAEQAPAVLELAEPLEGDSAEVALFRPLLKATRLERAALRLAYDANEHGWTSEAFHRTVDGFGAAVVLARTAGAVFGGFNPRGWIVGQSAGLGEDRNSLSAFLFTWPDNDTAKPAYKLRKVGGAALAVLDDPNKGPRFGAEGLTIPMESFPGRERLARSRLGAYYERRPDGGRHLFAQDENPKGQQLVDLKVYVAEGGGETWQLDGIVWKTGTAEVSSNEE